MTIYLTHTHPACEFAAAELARVLQRMGGEVMPVVAQPGQPAPPDGLSLGLLRDFGLGGRFRGSDAALDDQVFVDVTGGAGVIAGSNPRSLLLAVYRFLTAAGCRWVRPGPEGEIVPRRELRHLHVQLDEAAAFRQRTLCLDGAANSQTVLDLVDWAPKLGFSGYFWQFGVGTPFFERRDPLAAGTHPMLEPTSADLAQEYTRRIAAELHRRGLDDHAAGLGWDSAAGLPPRLPCAFAPDPVHQARFIHQELRDRRDLGPAGRMSRPVQCIFLPHALVLTVLGRTLWNPDSDFSELAADYFNAAFGPDALQAQAYLEALGEVLDLTWLQAGTHKPPPANLGGRVESARQVMRHFAEIIEHNHGLREPAQARSWEYLGWHTQILQCFCGLLQACAENEPAEVVCWWHCLRDFILENELPLQPVMDVAAFIETYRHLESGA